MLFYEEKITQIITAYHFYRFFFGHDRVSGKESGSKEEECASIKNISNSPIDIMCEQHIAIMRSFVNNLKNRQAHEVVKQIAYPLAFWKKGKKVGVLTNPRQLVKYYDHVFPEQIVSKISTAFKNDTKYFWNDQGIMFGGGSVWFNKESGKVITLNTFDPKLLDQMFNKITQEPPSMP